MSEKTTLRRLKIFSGLVTIVFAVIIWRFGEMQLLETRKFKTLSEQNRIRLITLKATRGLIKDCKGRVLVKNKTYFVVSINDMGSIEKTLAAVEKVNKDILKLPNAEINKIRGMIIDPYRRKFEPIKLMENVPHSIVAKLQERKLEFDGIVVAVEPIREYVYINGSPTAPHLLGYTNKISYNQWEKNKEKFLKLDYSPNDRIGQTGLEKYYEKYLRGKDGARQIEVDANFIPVRELGKSEPIGGSTLTLSLDAKLQNAAEKALDNAMLKVKRKYPKAKAGALVLLDVRTGAILAMASRPGFDPNLFSRKITQAEVDAMYRVKDFPSAINRAMYDYAPGSTFKMVTAIAGLETGKISPNEGVYDSGGITVGDKTFTCWHKYGHGLVNLEKALEVSCNTYFYKQGQKIGIRNINQYAKELGLGEETGIDLPDEKKGIRPSPYKKLELKGALYDALLKDKIKEIDKKYRILINKAPLWQKEELFSEKEAKITALRNRYKNIKRYESSWQRYDTINTTIGQGFNSYSPLQLANYAAAIGTKGLRYQPFLVEKVQDINGKVIYRHKKQLFQRAKISQKTFNIIKQSMYKVTHGYRGTASTFRYFPIKIGGKTGTAENPPRDNNALFVGFAPYDQPQVAFAALIEQGGHGGESAAPAVKEILTKYFNLKPIKVTKKSITSIKKQQGKTGNKDEKAIKGEKELEQRNKNNPAEGQSIIKDKEIKLDNKLREIIKKEAITPTE